jgi:hypothetical protein
MKQLNRYVSLTRTANELTKRNHKYYTVIWNANLETWIITDRYSHE